MIRISMSSLRPWKDSPLTLIMVNVDERLHTAISRPHEVLEGVERACGCTRVRLERLEGHNSSLKTC